MAEDSLDFPADSEEWSTYTQEVVDFFALRRSFLREELACDFVGCEKTVGQARGLAQPKTSRGARLALPSRARAYTRRSR